MDKVTFTYEDTDNHLNVSSVGVDENLSEIFARFIELTRIMDFQPGSWKHVLEEALSWANEEDADVFDYATEILVEKE